MTQCIKDTEPDKLVAMKVMRKDAEYNTLPVESETIRCKFVGPLCSPCTRCTRCAHCTPVLKISLTV
jgi:hypothetical protein